jgi:hypothetical protein
MIVKFYANLTRRLLLCEQKQQDNGADPDAEKIQGHGGDAVHQPVGVENLQDRIVHQKKEQDARQNPLTNRVLTSALPPGAGPQVLSLKIVIF